RILRAVRIASFSGIVEETVADFWRLIEEFLAIGGVVHFEHDLGDDLGVPLVADVDDVRITVRRRSPRTRRRETTNTSLPAGLGRADDVRAPVGGYEERLLPSPLVIPEDLADNLDLRIGATELNVAHVQDHQPLRTERRVVRRRAEAAGLYYVQPRPGLVGGQIVGPAIAVERPGEEMLRIGRIGDVNDRHG